MALVIDPKRIEYWEEVAKRCPKLYKALTPRLTKYIPRTHPPTEKQAAFLLLDNLESFYGGAAGGGKSDALLMAGLQYVDYPEYSGLILRRTYKDLSLPSSILDRAHEWLRPTDARYHPKLHQYTFPSGSNLTFGYLAHESDVYQYDSAQFQFVGFDELTQFSERQYRFLFSRMRRQKGSRVPLRMRSASNPGGIGHLWVKSRFIMNAQRHKRVFIPARLEDNPHVDIESYDEALQELDPVLRMQRRFGDWDVVDDGNIFKRDWFTKFLQERPQKAVRVRYWDLAATEGGGDFFAGALVARYPDKTWGVENIIRGKHSPAKVEAIIKSTAQADGRAVRIRLEQEPGSSGKTVCDMYVRMLAGYDVKGIPSTGNKVTRWRPFAAQAEAGNVLVYSAPWNSDWIDELCAVPNSEHDDQADATAGAFNAIASDPQIKFEVSRL